MTDTSITQTAALMIRDRQVAAVHTITQRLFSRLSLDERLHDILQVSIQAVDCEAGSVYLHRVSDDSLVFRHVAGPSASSELEGQTISAHEGIAGCVYQTGSAEITNNPSGSGEHRRDIGEGIGFVTRNMVTVPIVRREGKPVGVMQLLNKRAGDFDAGDLEVLEIIASIAATSVENAELQREAQLAAVAHAVGDLSHDIKNKIAPIKMATDMLRPDLDEMFAGLDAIVARMDAATSEQIVHATRLVRDEYAENCAIILDQVQAVQEHTRRIADVLKGTITKPSLEMGDAAPAVRKQAEQLEPVARQRQIAITIDVPDTLLCRFDRFFLSSAVYNLVNNAIPETPPGGSITVRMDARPDGAFPGGGYLLIEVVDTGKGMPPHVLERVLNGDATSTKPGGSGLGTRIVFNAVAAHGGRFEGESRPGVGTTLRMRLPLLTH